MPRINSYGRVGSEFHVDQVVKLKLTAPAALLKHGRMAKIVEIRGHRLLVHLGHGAHGWVSGTDIVQS
jgi:hypothetical protein